MRAGIELNGDAICSMYRKFEQNMEYMNYINTLYTLLIHCMWKRDII